MSNQRGISKPIIIAIVAVIAVVGLIGYFVATRDKGTSSDNSANTAGSDSSDGSTPAFAPKDTAGVSYVAKLSGTAGDSNIAATIEYDENGDTHYVGTAPEASEMYQIGSEYIICSSGTCISTKTSNEPAGSDQAAYSSEDVASWRNTAAYKGKQSCPAGSCDAWQVAQDGYTGTIFVASDGRVSRTTWVSDESNMTIDLDYKDVTITRPKNVQTIPGM